MSYPAYSEYKDSGVEWLGNVPSHWNIVRLKYACSLITKKVSTDGENVIALENVEGFTGNYIETSQEYSGNDVGFYEGDILFGKLRPYLAKVFLAKNRGVAFGDLLVYRPIKEVLSTYAFNQIIADGFISEVDSSTYGSKMPRASVEFVSDMPFLMPMYEEQTQIATFLDRETQKIDRLIEKQQQLIKLLQEKRQAVISHAVTKGLNPNAKMKDSGVEWLGDVPEHWEVKKLRFLGGCQNSINIGAEYFGSGYPFVSYGDVYNNRVLPLVGSGLVQSSELDRARYSVKYGDVFFTRTSETIDEIGFSSACINDIESATFAGFLIRFRPTENLITIEFSKHYFGNILLRAFFVKEMNLVTRASLSQDLLKKLPVVIPPI